MSIHTRSNQYGKILGDWHIRKEIGEGSGGQTVVYQIFRKDADWEEICALKAVPLISEWGEFSALPDYRKQEYLKALSERKTYAKKEVQLMSKLRGRTNIVDYIDYHTAEWEDDGGFGCDFLIRMELLQNLRSEIKRGRIFSKQEIIKIGMDICNALIVCHGKSIIHRDIKPENIFINDDGDYKLGDFGISRIIDACPGASATTGIGTPEYAAPEQDKGKYDVRVDLYSLGVVLYELSNRNRLPFADNVYNTEKATLLRMAGNKLPVPSNASADFARVILKACAFKADERYQTAEEMLEALEQLSATRFPTSVKLEKNPTRDTPDTFETVPAMEASRNKNSFATVPAIAKTSNKATEEMSDPVLPQSNTKDNLLSRANSGDAAAQVQLGVNYCRGAGVSTDADQAFYWFKKAANQGHALGQYNLGLCYELGRGIRKNIKTAEKLYRKAADQGCEDAKKRLASILQDLAEKRAQQESALKKAWLVQGFVVPFIAVILGCIMWFTSVPIWHTMLVITPLGAISLISLSIGASGPFKLRPLAYLVSCIAGAICVPLITAIVITIIEGVLWLCR